MPRSAVFRTSLRAQCQRVRTYVLKRTGGIKEAKETHDGTMRPGLPMTLSPNLLREVRPCGLQLTQSTRGPTRSRARSVGRACRSLALSLSLPQMTHNQSWPLGCSLRSGVGDNARRRGGCVWSPLRELSLCESGHGAGGVGDPEGRSVPRGTELPTLKPGGLAVPHTHTEWEADRSRHFPV